MDGLHAPGLTRWFFSSQHLTKGEKIKTRKITRRGGTKKESLPGESRHPCFLVGWKGKGRWRKGEGGWHGTFLSTLSYKNQIISNGEE